MAHALECLARLIRLLLGRSAVAANKLECGASLCILGVDIMLSFRGFHCKPAAAKVGQWICIIEEALGKERLPPGLASKLAGKLSWGVSKLFKRLGRAMLRPLFDQRSRRDGSLSPELRRALGWWLKVLRLGLAELRRWEDAPQAPMHGFCDASGSPPHLGAVLFDGSEWWWTHMEPPAHILASFRRRADNQIMALELLAISLALGTFADILRGGKVVIHSDNTGSEVGRHAGFPVLGLLCLVARCALGGVPQGRTTTRSSCTLNGWTLQKPGWRSLLSVSARTTILETCLHEWCAVR